MRTRAPVSALLVAAALAGCRVGLHRAGPPPSPYCRSGDPLAGVYHPSRLVVKSHCRVASGTVEVVRFEPYDGDVHIELRLNPGQDGLVTRVAIIRGGRLVADEPASTGLRARYRTMVGH